MNIKLIAQKKNCKQLRKQIVYAKSKLFVIVVVVAFISVGTVLELRLRFGD